MADNRGAVVAWSGAVCAGAGALAVLVAGGKASWERALFIALVVIAGLAFLLLLAAGFQGARSWWRARERAPRPRKPGPPITDRWRVTNSGFEVGALMHLWSGRMSHPGYMRSTDEKPPSVRIGMLVGCDALGPTPELTELRSRFRALLASQPIMDLVSRLSVVGSDESWRSLPGSGRWMLEAALMTEDQAEDQNHAPVASATMLLPEDGMPARFGTEPRSAELILHIEPRTNEGKPTPPEGLAEWQDRFTQALGLPITFTEFLTNHLGLATSDDPATKFALIMDILGPLTELVDIGDLKPMPGAQVLNQFTGWAVAEPAGKSVRTTARDLMVQLCQGPLGLDGYESALPPAT
jgi:hypothetical protein